MNIHGNSLARASFFTVNSLILRIRDNCSALSRFFLFIMAFFLLGFFPSQRALFFLSEFDYLLFRRGYFDDKVIEFRQVFIMPSKCDFFQPFYKINAFQIFYIFYLLTFYPYSRLFETRFVHFLFKFSLSFNSCCHYYPFIVTSHVTSNNIILFSFVKLFFIIIFCCFFGSEVKMELFDKNTLFL